ncbi:MAG: bifunctional [glutamine synthetase] adenylyltransferase/[glutamine synthetase]-adenylyl-L-tyrosine phosphorylase, partial [Rhodospirillaceae bacterium]|nr:bifunctional [glutamine synthetase] adenylyltransferase/[glutamine synthetase]-adenylyl-L-tyrosine phosphorylase [Rhodospirillaceae bacterium]
SAARPLPRPADPQARERGWAEWRGLQDSRPGPPLDPGFQALLDGVFGSSPFLTATALRHPDLIAAAAGSGWDAAFARVAAELDATPTDDLKALMQALRRCKARAALVIGLADLAGAWSVAQVTAALSDVADVAVRKTVEALLRDAAARGELTLPEPDAPPESLVAHCGYVVLALGKHGARELNYSSDIDLYVLFDETRLPYVGKRSAAEFAVRLTREFVRILQERTADGYVFRTDLRLRPDPGSTAIAVSRQAATIYYESYGQNWERAALIKARFVAGDPVTATAFLKDIETFIWRRSLDFYALQDIHSIKRQIHAHKGGGTVAVAGHNVKLGRGGIREIEFFAQTQQLIWGGRRPEARSPRTVAALEVLTDMGVVAPEVRDDLKDAYEFLRRLEHRLQMINDEQTQKLPADDSGLKHVALFSGYDDLAAFTAAVTAVLLTVEKHYAALFEESSELTVGGNLVFTGTEDDPDTLDTLRRLGFKDPSLVSRSVRNWHTGKYRATRTLRARQILTELMPALLIAFGRTAEADAAFVRFDQCLAQLNAGVQLLSVFQANPKLLDLIAEIMGDAPRLAEAITRNPALLDFVLDPAFFRPVRPLDEMASDLHHVTASADNFEAFLEAVRRWANEQRFRIGVQMLQGTVDPLTAARQLSDVAEGVLAEVMPRVSAEFAAQFGRVPDSELTAIAYGKLGSRELTPSSDLDLVLVYTGAESTPSAGGERSLPASAYYIRLGQRIVTAMTALSGQGRLYEIDLRLRPQGAKGPLACSVESFTKYLAEDAWTWEHMALTRARVVVASDPVRAQLGSAIAQVLDRPRPAGALVAAVADMRARMRREHKAEQLWQLKRRGGGLIDIEFIAQYLRLTRPAPVGLAAGGVIGMLRHFAGAGQLTGADADVLAGGYALLSRLQMLIRLTLPDDQDQPPFPEGLTRKLCRLADAPDFAALELALDQSRAGVAAVYDRLIDLPAAAARSTLGADTPR